MNARVFSGAALTTLLHFPREEVPRREQRHKEMEYEFPLGKY